MGCIVLTSTLTFIFPRLNLYSPLAVQFGFSHLVQAQSKAKGFSLPRSLSLFSLSPQSSMADRTASDTRLHMSAAPPYQISKDFQGPDNPIPLSPQWLLPKPGESKPGTGTVENHVIPTPPYGNRSESVKTSGNGEDVHDAHKRKDVFRPSMLDPESGRHRWRDEERDTKFVRKDHWRDGDKDLGDARKVDRWTENLSTRHFGESRRGIPDRWNDSSNRETNYDQRRESKWNTRWGPDDKDSEGLHEKWGGSGKDGEVHMDKGLSNISNHGKDEKEGDHYRPWKPNSSLSRGRVEPPHHQSLTPNKQVSTFSYGRGRGENIPSVFSLGRGRVGPSGSPMNNISSYPQYPGTNLDKVESVPAEPGPSIYSRTKLLDVYRATDMHAIRKFVDEFVQVPYLMQDEPLEPLALCVPTSEELDVLKGIDKGEIISSGAPQVPKDGWNSTDVTQSRRMKLGSAPLHDRGEDGVSYRLADEVPGNRELTLEEDCPINPGAALRAMPLSEHSNSSLHDMLDVKSRNLDMGWSHQPKDPHSQRDSNLSYLSNTTDVSKWQTNEDSIVKRQLSGIFDSGLETRRVPQTPPEELSLFYKDPRGQIQGPFKGIDIIGWFEAGYFGIDLPVRLENAAADSPWLSLGDAMPHLRAKACPPPGFSAPKSNDYADAFGRQNSNTFGSIHSGLSEIEIMRNDSRNRQSSSIEAENRFLESLMSGNKSSPPFDSQALSEGVDTGNNLYLLAKRMALDRQKSIPNTYQYWPGRDAASLVSKSDIVPDAPALPHSKLFSSVSDNSLQPQSQNADLMSIIQGLSDRSSTVLNSGVVGWSNYSVQGGLDPLQNKIDIHHDQNFPQGPLGFQPQKLQTQNQLSFSNLVAQAVDNPSGILTAEKLLSSGLSQDPQILNMLQQQYLLQLHSQAAVPLQQMSLLDKLLLLKQQQKQEEQQQLLRQQQEQQLLSQVLQEHQSQQRHGDSSYAQLQGGGIPMGNLRMDPSQIQLPQEISPSSSQTPIPSMQDTLAKTLSLPIQAMQDTSYTVSSEAAAPPMPHQIFGNITTQKSWGPILPEQSNELHQKESLPVSTTVESSLWHENRTKEESVQKSLSASDTAVKSLERMPDNICKADGIFLTATSESSEHSMPVQCVAPDVGVPSAVNCGIEFSPAANMDINVKIEPESAHEEQPVGRDKPNDGPSFANTRNVEAREPKKSSEKKSKKQKSSKSQSSDQAKGLPKNLPLEQSKQSEAPKPDVSDIKLGEANKREPVYETNLQQTRDKNNQSGTATEVADKEVTVLPAAVLGRITETVVEGDLKAVNSVSTQNTELPVGRAWKPAPGIKAKSLLEIQQEEQRKAQTETLVSEIATSVNSMSLSTPWVGAVANPDSVKVPNESQRELGNIEYLNKLETSQNPKGKKSQLHDILAEEVLKESSERDVKIPDMSSSQYTAAHSDSIDDNNFIEAKDSKRNRKKSTKSKGSGAKVSIPITSSEVAIGTSPIEKGKSSRTVQVEKEVVPAIPVGPSLGDFVPWKGEPVSPSPSPAWSADAGRVPKPTSLRDILKEQEKKASSAVLASQLPTPQKSHPTQAAQSSGSSWSISASSPSKAVSPIHSSSHSASQSKYKVDDDLFWGPIEQSKQETKQSDFPQLASEGSLGSRKVPIKGNSPGSSNRQKSVSVKPVERSLSSSPASTQSLLKLRKDAMTKHSEAMDFRNWCEKECVRLIGTKDTSFLEFCLKQSRSEAEMLLIENLGSYDPDHEFIDKFLNYKELLPSDVLEIAFQSRNDHKVPGRSAGDTNPGDVDIKDLDHSTCGSEGSSKGGGKKKGKKGKKVSPSVLGFNVVSNRIMMGEIQTVED